MKKAQILGVLTVVGVLGMAMPGRALALEGANVVETETSQVAKPSMVTLINATNDAEIAAMEARQAGETGYTTYLNGLVEQSIKVQNEYAKRTGEDITELVDALLDGAYVTRLMIQTNSQAVAQNAVAAVVAEVAAPVPTKQAIAKPNQTAKVVLTTPKVVAATTIKQVSAPNTSAGKPAIAATSARNTMSVTGSLAAVVLAAGVVAKLISKILPKRVKVIEDVEN